MTPEFLQVVNEHAEDISHVCQRLDRLANIHFQAGNERLANELTFLSKNLTESRDILGSATGDEVTKSFVNANLNSRAMYEAVLVGIKVGEASK